MNLSKPLFVALLIATTSGCSPLLTDDETPPPPKPTVVENRVRIAWLPHAVTRYASLIDEASFRHGVDANLIALVMLAESGGDAYAVSPAGAVGLMQIMPDTARDIAARRGMPAHVDVRLYEPAYNIDFGAWYLARQLERFATTDADVGVDRAVMAYNGGPDRVAGHLVHGTPLPLETQRYRHWVGGMWRQRFEPRSRVYDDWWQAGGQRMVAKASTTPAPMAGIPFPPTG